MSASANPLAPGDSSPALRPGRDDYFVLKPGLSAFHCTPLELLLRDLRVKRVIATGVAGDQCVLATLIDARMRELEVVVPRDGVASLSTARNQAFLRQVRETFQSATTAAARVRLSSNKP